MSVEAVATIEGTVLNYRYQVEQVLNDKGGMGLIYRATDLNLRSTVVLKKSRFVDEQSRGAFEREARLLYGLRHNALPRVIDYFITEDSSQFFVMEFIPGQDLSEMLGDRVERGQGPFAVDLVLEWGDQLLDALHYLHNHVPPIIHRDIKPQNLKLMPNGQIILLDFGLAKGAVSGMTLANASIQGYTPNYAPLEQMRGSGTDARSDIYSLAVTMHCLLTGQMPPDAVSRAIETLSAQPDPLRPIHEITKNFPLPISEAIARACSLNQNERPATAQAMREVLRLARQRAAQLEANVLSEISLHVMPVNQAEARREVTPAPVPPVEPVAVAPTPVKAAPIPAPASIQVAPSVPALPSQKMAEAPVPLSTPLGTPPLSVRPAALNPTSRRPGIAQTGTGFANTPPVAVPVPEPTPFDTLIGNNGSATGPDAFPAEEVQRYDTLVGMPAAPAEESNTSSSQPYDTMIGVALTDTPSQPYDTVVGLPDEDSALSYNTLVGLPDAEANAPYNTLVGLPDEEDSRQAYNTIADPALLAPLPAEAAPATPRPPVAKLPSASPAAENRVAKPAGFLPDKTSDRPLDKAMRPLPPQSFEATPNRAPAPSGNRAATPPAAPANPVPPRAANPLHHALPGARPAAPSKPEPKPALPETPRPSANAPATPAEAQRATSLVVIEHKGEDRRPAPELETPIRARLRQGLPPAPENQALVRQRPSGTEAQRPIQRPVPVPSQRATPYDQASARLRDLLAPPSEVEKPSQGDVLPNIEMTGMIATPNVAAVAPKGMRSFTEIIALNVRMEMHAIPGGEFLMGSAEKRGYADECPQHRVTLSAFYIGKYPITQAQWRAVMRTNPSHFSGNNHPVDSVTWDEAVEFCRRLSYATSRSYRLPTEAEWEFACRAGTTSLYNYGDEEELVTQYAWCLPNASNHTHAVGEKKPNGWGLYDMHGNVWEWCFDWYGSDYYQHSPNVNPAGPSRGTSRVLRGGSWYSLPNYCRSAGRSNHQPDLRDPLVGFRVVCDAKPS